MARADLESFDNVFYDTFDEVKQYEFVSDVWEEACVICLADSSSDVGLFAKSDIIISYDKQTRKPTIITERIFRKNYSARDWRKMQRFLRNKLKVIREELGFHISVSFARDYIDYVHYKQEWWLWAKNIAEQR